MAKVTVTRELLSENWLPALLSGLLYSPHSFRKAANEKEKI